MFSFRYIISNKWWKEFLSNTELDDGDVRFEMVPISNRDIVDKGRKLYFFESNVKLLDENVGYRLKPDLLERDLASLLSEQAFNQLRSAFGVEDAKRDVIFRTAVKGTLMQEVIICPYSLLIRCNFRRSSLRCIRSRLKLLIFLLI